MILMYDIYDYKVKRHVRLHWRQRLYLLLFPLVEGSQSTDFFLFFTPIPCDLDSLRKLIRHAPLDNDVTDKRIPPFIFSLPHLFRKQNCFVSTK